jgi:hypothetical protein
MSIYVQHDGKQLGPFTEDEIKAQLASGAISPQDHVWWEGQKDWVVLSQTPYGGSITPGATVGPGTAAPYSGGGPPVTSTLAIWSLVCGCVSLLCGIFASIPAIILGHMGLSEIKKNPALQGRGMAIAGLVLGYIFTTIIVLYIVGVLAFVFLLHNNVKDVFKTITSQIAAAQAEQATNSADQTTPDQTTNAPDQTPPAPTPATTPDQSTNSTAPSMPAAAPATNAPDSTTNAAPMTQ